MTKWSFAIAIIFRWTFTIALIYGVYTETRVWTMIAFGLIAIKTEIEAA